MQRQAKSGGTPHERPIARGVWGPWTPCLLALALCLTALGDAGDEPPSADFSPRTHYKAVLAVARQRRVEPTNAVTAAWEFARACFDLAEHPADSGERQRLGNEGAHACREALALDPDSGPAQYYLALNLGQVAQTKLIGALRLVRQMETALLAAIRLDPDWISPDPTGAWASCTATPRGGRRASAAGRSPRNTWSWRSPSTRPTPATASRSRSRASPGGNPTRPAPTSPPWCGTGPPTGSD